MTAASRPVVPAPLYALGAIASVQVGATVARHLFPFLGPTGTVFVRVGFGALILLAIARPDLSSLTAAQWRGVVPFGLIIAGMNLSFYQSIARIPLGIAVTIEFLGPLAVAIAGSRKALDFVWAGLAAVGVAMLSVTGGNVTLLGVLFALGAAVGWAMRSRRACWPRAAGLLSAPGIKLVWMPLLARSVTTSSQSEPTLV